jgi:hypothetical protein
MGESLFKNCKKTIYIYTSIGDSEVVLVFKRNNAGLKKLSSFVWTEKWLICISKCHMSFKLCTQLLNNKRISEGLLYFYQIKDCMGMWRVRENEKCMQNFIRNTWKGRDHFRVGRRGLCGNLLFGWMKGGGMLGYGQDVTEEYGLLSCNAV